MKVLKGGAYLKQTGRDLASYQQLYQTHRSQVLKERRGWEHPDPVATTWQISFERVEGVNAAAADLLRVCSFLASDRIPEELLTTGARHLGPRLSLVAADGYLLDQAVEALQAYSLLRRDGLTRSLSVHRLVQVGSSCVLDLRYGLFQPPVIVVEALYHREGMVNGSIRTCLGNGMSREYLERPGGPGWGRCDQREKDRDLKRAGVLRAERASCWYTTRIEDV